MTAIRDALSSDYVDALDAYLRRGDEAGLARAYELGRHALLVGRGVLDAAEWHSRALVELVLASPDDERARRARAASDFFAEFISPFEMALRGYRSANDDLTRLNDTLSQQRDELEAVNRELESFSYSVSHDLRAPLRRIDGFSQAVLEDCGDAVGERGRQYLVSVRSSVRQLSQLIDDLLSLARVTRTELRRETVDVTALVHRICGDLQARAPGRSARFDIEGNVRAYADPGLVAIVLENLLGNAWKFTAKRDVASIAFGTGTRAGQRFYVVRDNGAGFDMKYAARLFGTFQRLHSSGEFEGTGIGLATVKRVVHRHHGVVWAEGALGQGASFFFTLGEQEPSR